MSQSVVCYPYNSNIWKNMPSLSESWSILLNIKKWALEKKKYHYDITKHLKLSPSLYFNTEYSCSLSYTIYIIVNPIYSHIIHIWCKKVYFCEQKSLQIPTESHPFWKGLKIGPFWLLSWFYPVLKETEINVLPRNISDSHHT